jgi:NADPH:quinone reductase-like Zn-dependent oxidoreductase
MKAIVYTQYGPPEVLHFKEVAKPVPQPKEILVKIHASPVNFGDVAARNFANIPAREFTMPLLLWLPARSAFGWRSPNRTILGSEFAGEVEAVGSEVTRFRPGDQVFGYRGESFGAYAEYLCMPEAGAVAIKPANMTYAEAATVPYGALFAVGFLRKANIQAGQKVLVNGASGAIGSYALQLAKHYGAEVTGVCGGRRVAMVQALGADKVIDYTRQDFTKNGESYDLILDILAKSSFSRCKGSLKPGGRYLLVSFKTKQLWQMLWTSLFGSKKVICALISARAEDLAFIKELIEAEEIKTVIDRCYPLEQAAAAHGYVESGDRRGAVVLTVGEQGAVHHSSGCARIWGFPDAAGTP